MTLTAGCGRSQVEDTSPPTMSSAEMARQQQVRDSIANVRRLAVADSVERARQAALVTQARVDSVARANRAATMAAQAAALAASARNTELRQELDVIVHFNFDAAAIGSDGRAALDRKVAILQANPTVRLRITGATDNRGSDRYNMALGTRRATAVRQYLVTHGVDLARLDIVSTGEASPLDAGTGAEAWARNRRAEFSVLGTGVVLAMK